MGKMLIIVAAAGQAHRSFLHCSVFVIVKNLFTIKVKKRTAKASAMTGDSMWLFPRTCISVNMGEWGYLKDRPEPFGGCTHFLGLLFEVLQTGWAEGFKATEISFLAVQAA